MSRDKNCRETIFVSLSCLAITLTVGVILKEESSPVLWARGSFGGILGDTLGEGNCELKIVASQFMPRDIKIQEVSEYGFVYGSKAAKVSIFGGFPVESPTKKATASKLF